MVVPQSKTERKPKKAKLTTVLPKGRAATPIPSLKLSSNYIINSDTKSETMYDINKDNIFNNGINNDICNDGNTHTDNVNNKDTGDNDDTIKINEN